MSESQTIAIQKAPADTQLQLFNKSSNKYQSRTTKTSVSSTPQLQTCTIFQKLLPGVQNQPLRKTLRTKQEQISFFQESKEQLLGKISSMNQKLEEVKLNKRRVCEKVRERVKRQFV